LNYVITVFAFLVILSGCSVTNTADISVSATCPTIGQRQNLSLNLVLYRTGAYLATNPRQQDLAACRNQVIDDVLSGSDEICDDFRRSIPDLGKEGLIHRLLHAAEPSDASRPLDKGALEPVPRPAFSSHREALWDTLVWAVDLRRQSISRIIRAKKKQPIADYGLTQAIHDLVEYDNSCGFPEIIDSLNQTLTPFGPQRRWQLRDGGHTSAGLLSIDTMMEIAISGEDWQLILFRNY
jgi:hypothetical protein